jgi:hypothetical protein
VTPAGAQVSSATIDVVRDLPFVAVAFRPMPAGTLIDVLVAVPKKPTSTECSSVVVTDGATIELLGLALVRRLIASTGFAVSTPR